MEADTQAGRPTLLEGNPQRSRDLVAQRRNRWSHARQKLVKEALEWQDDSGTDRQALARSVCSVLIERVWDQRTAGRDSWWTAWSPTGERLPLPLHRRIRKAAAFLDGQPLDEVCFSIGTVYTDLLPSRIRAARGAFYTPPTLTKRLLDLVEAQGFHWAAKSILDPACGGGAFLVPVAARVLATPEIESKKPQRQLEALESQLVGVEIDSFAAWMTRCFLQLLVQPLSQKADRPLGALIQLGDALELATAVVDDYDLVVGNPPYGRVRLDAVRRETFQRSLFGHANSYGLFLDAALRWRSPEGWIAFVTPTSFLGGRYFCRLRSLLLEEAPPRILEVVEHRTGVFDQVQQETCLAVFGPRSRSQTEVQLLRLDEGELEVTPAGAFSLPAQTDAPWLLPRTPRQAALGQRASRMKTRLHHLGYKASTGPLVWNRHKDQLRSSVSKPDTFPLVWAEAVRANRFRFEYSSRAHAPFVQVRSGQGHLLDSGPCVLVQRTTAKEQRRRLVACSVPQCFLEKWKHIVVENHVNVLRATGPGALEPAVLAAVLNTEAVDQVFRCLSGSVAVSATELHALPLPPGEVFDQVGALLHRERPAEAWSEATREEVEALVAEAYEANEP